MSFQHCVVLLIGLIVFGCVSAISSTDLIEDNLTWSCANNATCVRTVKNEVIRRLKDREPIRIGEFSIQPIAIRPMDGARSWSIINFLSGNALRIPLGPMMLSVQRSDEYNNYIEVALLKKSFDAGRGGGDDLGAGSGGGGGGIGGGLRDRKEKKHLQAYIPMFLAFNAIGWMLLAMKAVTLLTFKAFFVAKLAFVVAASIVIKKMMDTATEKMMATHHYEHSEPIMMPYNMEYAIPSHSYHAEGSDLYSLHVPANTETISHHSPEGMTAESSLNQVVNLQNVTNGPNLVGLQNVPKVKRQDRDIWTGLRRRPMIYNYLTANRKPMSAAYQQ